MRLVALLTDLLERLGALELSVRLARGAVPSASWSRRDEQDMALKTRPESVTVRLRYKTVCGGEGR